MFTREELLTGNLMSKIPNRTNLYLVFKPNFQKGKYDPNRKVVYNPKHLWAVFFRDREAEEYVEAWKDYADVDLGYTEFIWGDSSNRYWDPDRGIWVYRNWGVAFSPADVLIALKRYYGKDFRRYARHR